MDEITELLKQLEEETGIRFAIESKDSDPDTVITELKSLLSKTGSPRSREVFLRRLLLGQLSENQLEEGLAYFHLSSLPQAAFLLKFPSDYPKAVISVLGNYLPIAASSILIMDEQTLVVLLEDPDSDFSYSEEAHALADLINSEAMVSVYISYVRTCDSYRLLPDLYAQLQQTYEIGRRFKKNSYVYSYSNLGLGKLISKLSAADCDEFLRENAENIDFSAIDEETMSVVRSFFENDLSIAETARCLYLHRNTLVYRLDKFQKQTGLDIRKFHDAVICQIAMLMAEK